MLRLRPGAGNGKNHYRQSKHAGRADSFGGTTENPHAQQKKPFAV
jgi:hypothetical protein